LASSSRARVAQIKQQQKIGRCGHVARNIDEGLLGKAARSHARQREPERRPASRLAFKAHCAAQLFDHALGDGKPKARALVLARIGRVAGRERLEQMLGDFVGNAVARVAHGKSQMRLAVAALNGLDQNFHRTAFGELESILRELEQRLPDPAGIGGNARQVGRRGNIQPELLFPRTRLQQLGYGTRGKSRIALFGSMLLGVVARQGDDVIEQGAKPAPGFEHHLDVVAMRLFESCPLQQLRHAEQCVERCADLVADIGDEHRFRARAHLRRIARLFGGAPFFGKLLKQSRIVVAQAAGFVEEACRTYPVIEDRDHEKHHRNADRHRQAAAHQQQHGKRCQSAKDQTDEGKSRRQERRTAAAGAERVPGR